MTTTPATSTSDIFVKHGIQRNGDGEKHGYFFNVSAVGLPQPELLVAVMVGYSGFSLRLSQGDAVNLRNALTAWLDKVAEL